MNSKVSLGSNRSSTFWQDFTASIVVFLVALPLCLGIAIASGAPPAVGLITAIIGGIIVGYLSGCPLQVSGPAAGLVAIVWEAIQTHGLEGFGVIVLLAGVMQITAGVFRLGQWFRAVSPAVINGMLAGIGVLILASQFHVMLDDAPKQSGIDNLLSIPAAIQKGIFPLDGSTHHLAAALGILTIMTLIIWNYAPRKFKIVPPALVAVVVAVLAAAIFQLPVKFVSLPENFFSAINLPSLASINLLADGGIWVAALTIAFVASAETLLTAAAVDQMCPENRTRYNKEIIAQGVGNTLCGILGALPMTGVIVRSSANVQSGAKTRWSTIMHGFWMLVLVVAFPFLLETIPVCSLAAILVYTGYKLVNIKTIKLLWRYGKGEVLIYAVTLVGIVMTNLLEGVIIGFAVSALKLLYDFSNLEVRFLRDPCAEQATLFLRGSATFLSLPKLMAVLDTVPPGLALNVRFEKLGFIDHACMDLLTNWERQYSATGGSLEIEWNELKGKFNRPLVAEEV